MRRLLQAQGAEVVHLGHNRSVDEVVRAAVEEDVQGVAVSSYQGGHTEYFKYLVDRLRGRGPPRGADLRGRRGRHRGGGDRGARGLRRAADLLPRRRPASRARADDQSPHRGMRPRRDRRRAAVAGCTAQWRPPVAGPVDQLPRGRIRRQRRHRVAAARLDGDSSARARSHRHRWVGQVLTDRRAHPALPTRPRGQALDRRPGRRPHPPAGRRCPARGPHPHECDRRRQRLLPIDGHPELGVRAAGPLPARRSRPVLRPASTWSSRRPRASVRGMPR